MDDRRRAALYESLNIELPAGSILPVDSPDDCVSLPFNRDPTSMAKLYAADKARSAKWDIPAIWFLDIFGAWFESDTPQAQVTAAFYYMRDVLGADLRILIEEPHRTDEVRLKLDPDVFEYLAAMAKRGSGDSFALAELRSSGKVPF